MSTTELKSLIELLTARPAPENETVAQRRDRFGKLGQLLPAPPDAQVTVAPVGGVPAETVAAPGTAGDRVILYLHGGGYVIGGPDTHRALAYNLSRAADARVVVLDYRLAPEHPFPAAVEDATAAYGALLAAGTPPGRIVVAGDSAGGGLVVGTLLSLRDAGQPLPAGGFCISPWTDMEGTGESLVRLAARDVMVQKAGLAWMASLYMNGADPRHPYASPIHADLKGLPPLLIHVGSAEMLFDDAIRLAERAHAADVDVTVEVGPNMVHVWHLFAPILGEGLEAIGRAGHWIAWRTGRA